MQDVRITADQSTDVHTVGSHGGAIVLTGDHDSVPLSATMETTHELLVRAKAGDSMATEELFKRCLPALRRWARGRLPEYARDVGDTGLDRKPC